MKEKEPSAGLLKNGKIVSPESGEEDLGARELFRRDYSAGPVSQTCITY